MRKEYGVAPKEYQDMKWDEFKALISGLGPNTALGRIVAIRSEEDEDVLKSFTKEQKRIRNEYRNRMAKNVSKEDMNKFLEEMQNAFVGMVGEKEAVVSESS